MPDFSRRSEDPEIMDDLQYEGRLMDQTLRELEIINRLLGGNAVTLDALGRLLGDRKPENLSIADLGCGRGDMLMHIRKWCQHQRIKTHLTGIDANPYIISAAKNNLGRVAGIDLQAINIFSADFKVRRFDVVIGTLFYHHFSNDELVAFFRQLRKQSAIGFIINDIHRHPLAYHSIRILTKLFSKSTMVQYDAPLSVLRAFSKRDIQEIMRAAGVQDYDIRWKWAFRWQVIVRSQAS